MDALDIAAKCKWSTLPGGKPTGFNLMQMLHSHSKELRAELGDLAAGLWLSPCWKARGARWRLDRFRPGREAMLVDTNEYALHQACRSTIEMQDFIIVYVTSEAWHTPVTYCRTVSSIFFWIRSTSMAHPAEELVFAMTAVPTILAFSRSVILHQLVSYEGTTQASYCCLKACTVTFVTFRHLSPICGNQCVKGKTEYSGYWGIGMRTPSRGLPIMTSAFILRLHWLFFCCLKLWRPSGL